MKRWISFAALAAAFALATRFGWWAVPVVAALWGVMRPAVNAPAVTAALAAASAWALWLLGDWQTDHQAMEILSTRLGGVMGIPPVDDEPSLYFALLREIARRHHLPWVSMGMSSDFALAIQQGATHVRIGTALFGVRV